MEPQYDAQDMAIADLAEQNHVLKTELKQLREFVKDVAGLSLFIADSDHEFKLIQRARTLVGQPEF